MTISENTKSDELADLRRLFTGNGLFSAFGSLLEIKLILDANAVLADIRWLVCKARNQEARTSLIESLDAETIVAYAPTYLEIEIIKNIPLIASNEKVDPKLLFEKWELLKNKIIFIESGEPVDGELDPKDAPYVRLHEATGHPVLSTDRHIPKMGAKVISIQITAHAKDYSRCAAIEYKIKAGALGAFYISATVIKAASDFLRSLTPALKRIPSWAWLLLIGLFAWAMTCERVRNWLKIKIEALTESSKNLSVNLMELLQPIILEYQENNKKTTAAKKLALKEINA